MAFISEFKKLSEVEEEEYLIFLEFATFISNNYENFKTRGVKINFIKILKK